MNNLEGFAEGGAIGLMLYPVVEIAGDIAGKLFEYSGLVPEEQSKFLGRITASGLVFQKLGNDLFSTGFKVIFIARTISATPHQGIRRANISHQEEQTWKKRGCIAGALAAVAGGAAFGIQGSLCGAILVNDLFFRIANEVLA